MKFYRIAMAALLLAASLSASAAIAPATVPHGTALFLDDLSSGGKKSVTFKAQAVGTRFFFEEPTGVTVYVFDGNGYRKETFLKGYKLGSAIKKYRK